MNNLGIYIEAILLYMVIFFISSVSAFFNVPSEQTVFSVSAEIYRIALYYLPSLALIWFLLFRGQAAYILSTLKPCKKDIISGLIAFPCIFITGLAISFISAKFSVSSKILILRPSSGTEWIALCFTIFFASYLEESFFRYYLITKSESLKIRPVYSIIISVILFSICHIYEGPWGVLNAVISSSVLALLFIKYKAIHGIAIAHALYNIAASMLN